MKNFILHILQEIDKPVKELVKKGFHFCFFILLFSSILLFTYECFYTEPNLYYIGLSIFKMGVIYMATFLGFGVAFNELRHELL